MQLTFGIWLATAVVVLVEAQYQSPRSQSYQPQPQYQQSQYEQPQYEPQPQYQQSQQPQYQPQYRQQAHQEPTAALPAILMHKQTLGNDGSFNYAFAADNGLQQGETISPDGTRAGSYSYVDPNGKTIKVKYTAGKDGFKVLEGDHLPKAPAPVAPQPAGPSYSGVYQGAPSPARAYQGAPSYTESAAPQYSPQGANTVALFGGQRQSVPSSSLYQVQDDYSGAGSPVYQSTAPATFPSAAQRQPLGQPQERQVPHNFGAGYSFEFAG